MNRLAGWGIVAWTVVVVSAAAYVWAAYPEWLAADESASATLRNLAFVAAAIIGLPIAIWRGLVAERQADASLRQIDGSHRSLLNERFQNGARMLGEPPTNPSARLGGIHALARLANECPDFRPLVLQLFAAFAVAESRRRDVPSSDSDIHKAPPIEEGTNKPCPANGPPPDRKPAELYYLDAKARVPFIPPPPKDVAEAIKQIAERVDVEAVECESVPRLDLADASLGGLTLQAANLSNCDFTKADLRRLRAWQASFARSVLPGANLAGANLYGADFRGVDMRRIDLTGANLAGANLQDANLGFVDLASQNLWGGRLFPSKLIGTILSGADLSNADLSGASLEGAGLGGANLHNVTLSGAKLQCADLRAASLVRARLDGADLALANLGGAGADLKDACLAGANLANANLAGANLEGADLTDADLTGADLAYDHLFRERPSPARGLTQTQLDKAVADPGRPPRIEGITDPHHQRPTRLAPRPVSLSSPDPTHGGALRRRGTPTTIPSRHAASRRGRYARRRPRPCS